jgi:hypothetical protein
LRAARAVEAIAVEVFRQAESSGQPVSMSMINRVCEQLRAASVVVPVRALRRSGGESAS